MSRVLSLLQPQSNTTVCGRRAKQGQNTNVANLPASDNTHQTPLFYLCCEIVLGVVLSEDAWPSLLFWGEAGRGVLDFPWISHALHASHLLSTRDFSLFPFPPSIRKLMLEGELGKIEYFRRDRKGEQETGSHLFIWFFFFLRSFLRDWAVSQPSLGCWFPDSEPEPFCFVPLPREEAEGLSAWAPAVPYRDESKKSVPTGFWTLHE